MKHKLIIHSDFSIYMKFFLELNSKHNLISKNDEKFLYEKHIYDSLAVGLFFEKYPLAKFQQVLDIGCGGGFPCVPLAIEYPNLNITGIDSINKKIAAVTELKAKLQLNNLSLICERVENLKSKQYDIILSRAVANLDKISSYALPLLKKDGYFIAYKSKKAQDEIFEASKTFARYNAKIIDIIDYTLPLDEVYERKLICIKK